MEKDFDEFENDDEVRYTITPKGILCTVLHELGMIDSPLDTMAGIAYELFEARMMKHGFLKIHYDEKEDN